MSVHVWAPHSRSCPSRQRNSGCVLNPLAMEGPRAVGLTQKRGKVTVLQCSGRSCPWKKTFSGVLKLKAWERAAQGPKSIVSVEMKKPAGEWVFFWGSHGLGNPGNIREFQKCDLSGKVMEINKINERSQNFLVSNSGVRRRQENKMSVNVCWQM